MRPSTGHLSSLGRRSARSGRNGEGPGAALSNPSNEPHPGDPAPRSPACGSGTSPIRTRAPNVDPTSARLPHADASPERRLPSARLRPERHVCRTWRNLARADAVSLLEGETHPRHVTCEQACPWSACGSPTAFSLRSSLPCPSPAQAPRQPPNSLGNRLPPAKLAWKARLSPPPQLAILALE